MFEKLMQRLGLRPEPLAPVDEVAVWNVRLSELREVSREYA